MCDDAMGNGIILVCIYPVVDTHTIRGLASESDCGWFTTETRDVVPKPLDRSPLIAKTQILDLARGTREAENVETVVDGYDDDVFGLNKVLGVVEWTVGVANGKSSSVGKAKNRLVRLHVVGYIRTSGLGPDV